MAKKPGKDLLHDGKLALGVAVGVIFAIFVYLALQLSSLDFTADNLVEAVLSLPVLIVATISLYISRQALSEQKLIRQAGTDPVLVAHLTSRKDTPAMVEFSISNVGAGAALDVHIDVDLKGNDWEADRTVQRIQEITHPIRAILQNTSISYDLGVGHRLLGNRSKGEEPIMPFEVTLRYKNIEGEALENVYVIDVREMRMRQAYSPALSNIAKEVKSISDSLRHMSTGFQPMKVVHQSKAEYETEKEKEYYELRKLVEEEDGEQK